MMASFPPWNATKFGTNVSDSGVDVYGSSAPVIQLPLGYNWRLLDNSLREAEARVTELEGRLQDITNTSSWLWASEHKALNERAYSRRGLRTFAWSVTTDHALDVRTLTCVTHLHRALPGSIENNDRKDAIAAFQARFEIELQAPRTYRVLRTCMHDAHARAHAHSHTLGTPVACRLRVQIRSAV